jgi:uncharacterized protein
MASNVGKILGRGFAFPPRLGPDGRFAWSEGSANIRDSIRVILMTEMRERLMLPDFGCGLRSFLYEPNVVTTHRLIEDRARRALATWEPRIRVEELTVDADPEDPDAAVLSITYQLIATGSQDRIGLTLLLGG